MKNNIVIREVKDKSDTLDMVDIRYKTFIEEMNIRYEGELDGSDKESTNFLLLLNNKGVGTIRFVQDSDGSFRFGRFALLKEYRHQGLGRKLFKYVEDYIINTYHPHKLYLHGMSYLKDFYLSLGYKITGNEFIEENIPHLTFEKYL